MAFTILLYVEKIREVYKLSHVRMISRRLVLLLLDVQLQLYNFLLLYFRNIRPNDGCLVQLKHVAVYNYYNKELGIDGLYVDCCILYRHNEDDTH